MMEDGTVASSVVESSSHGIDDTTKDDSKEEKHQSHTSYDDGVEVELSNEKERAVSIGNDEPNDVMIKSNEEVETGGHQYSSGFTSEIFKIEIRNIPPYIGFQQMRKKLNTLSLKPVKVKLLPQQSYCFVTFKNEEDRQVKRQLYSSL
jgi:tRNA (uracil-5-)-methyltransferase